MSRTRTFVVAAAALLPLAGPASTGAAPTKTTNFRGRIVAATGHYASLRGTVRLVLRSTGAVNQTPAATTVGFTLTLSAPSCKSQAVIRAPRRCVALHGTVSGRAQGLALRVPDVGRQFTLAAHGRVSTLGTVTATGTTSSLGFIARGQIPLTLVLANHAGKVTIQALGPLVNGFTSPF